MENKDIVENRGDDNDKQIHVVEAEDEKLVSHDESSMSCNFPREDMLLHSVKHVS